MGFRHITDRDAFAEMWTRGDALPEIAAHYRVTKGAVSSAARRFDLPRRKPGFRPVEAVAQRRAEANALLASGLSHAEIARVQGISKNLVNQDAFQFRRGS